MKSISFHKIALEYIYEKIKLHTLIRDNDKIKK